MSICYTPLKRNIRPSSNRPKDVRSEVAWAVIVGSRRSGLGGGWVAWGWLRRPDLIGLTHMLAFAEL